MERPRPGAIDQLYAPHYAALRERRLVVQECAHCGSRQWPPRELCFACHESEPGWVEVGPDGEVFTYTVVYRGFEPWFAERVPYGIVVVSVGPGLLMVGNYFGDDVESLECGMRVKASFEDVDDDLTLLQWERGENRHP